MWLQMQDGILQTVGLPAGSMMFHPAGVVHFDGAINGPTEIQIIGMGPSFHNFSQSVIPPYLTEPRSRVN